MSGFTLIELAMIMVLIGILAVVVLPSMNQANTFRAAGFHDEIVTALRYAQKTAISHRRLVCANVAATTVTLTIADANPANACNQALPGPDGNVVFAQSLDAANVTAAIAPAGPLFFQPTGLVTSDGAGTLPTDYAVAITNFPNITVVGTTGYVR